MDEKSFLRDYRDLSDVSDKNSDIMSSMLLDEKLREKGLGSLEDNIGRLARVRLSMSMFQKLYQEKTTDEYLDVLSTKEIVVQMVWCYIEAGMEEYSEEEKTAILLELLGELEDLRAATDDMDAALRKKNQREIWKEYRLVELEIALAEELADYVEKHYKVNSLVAEWAEKALPIQKEAHYSGGAAGASVYLDDEKLRNLPEEIGVMAGVCGGVAEELGENSDPADLIAVALLAIGCLMLYGIMLEVVAFPTFEVVDLFMVEGTLSWEAVVRAVEEGLRRCDKVLLKLAAGFGTAALTVKGTSQAYRELTEKNECSAQEKSRASIQEVEYETERAFADN